MATLDLGRRIVLALPETTVSDGGGTFSVGGTAFAWPWLERKASAESNTHLTPFLSA